MIDYIQSKKVGERNAIVHDAWMRYKDGAITYVEFVRKAVSRVDREDCIDHNESMRGVPEYVASWPFRG